MSAARRFPPVVELVVVSLATVVVGGILTASRAPRKPAIGLLATLLGLAVVLFLVGALLLSRVEDFAWSTWVRVGRWALLAYVVSAGMIEYAFVRNHTRGSTLAVVTGMLVMFALDVPMIIATTVARYANAPS